MDRPPFEPRPTTLAGQHASLVSLAAVHAQGLFDISQDESIWTWMLGPMWSSVDDARAWVEWLLERQAQGLSVPFVAMEWNMISLIRTRGAGAALGAFVVGVRAYQ